MQCHPQQHYEAVVVVAVVAPPFSVVFRVLWFLSDKTTVSSYGPTNGVQSPPIRDQNEITLHSAKIERFHIVVAFKSYYRLVVPKKFSTSLLQSRLLLLGCGYTTIALESGMKSYHLGYSKVTCNYVPFVRKKSHVGKSLAVGTIYHLIGIFECIVCPCTLV